MYCVARKTKFVLNNDSLIYLPSQDTLLNQKEKFSDQNIQDIQDIDSKIQACRSGADRHVAVIHQQQNNGDSSQQADWLELEQTLNDLGMDINVLATRIEQLADEH